MASEIKLNPCPFCGSEAMLIDTAPNGPRSVKGFFVQCSNNLCRATGLFSAIPGKAVEAWNRRDFGEPLTPEMTKGVIAALDVVLEREDMQTPCTCDPANGKDFMTSSEYGVCDGDGFPISDESIASALSAVAEIQAAWAKMRKEKKRKGGHA